jgi:WD40 repeat protein
MEHRDEILVSAFSEDSQLIITGSADGRAQVWTAASGTPIGQPVTHESRLTDVGFAPDGRSFYTLDRGTFGGQGDIRLWSVPEEEPGPNMFDLNIVAVDTIHSRVAVRVGNLPDNLLARPKSIVVHDIERNQAILPPVCSRRQSSASRRFQSKRKIPGHVDGGTTSDGCNSYYAWTCQFLGSPNGSTHRSWAGHKTPGSDTVARIQPGWALARDL